MKHSDDQTIPRLAEFELLTPAPHRAHAGRFLPGPYYAAVGLPGLWRRVERREQGLRPSWPDAVVGVFEGELVEVVRDQAAEAELLEAGFLIQAGAKATPSPGPGLQQSPSLPVDELSPDPWARQRATEPGAVAFRSEPMEAVPGATEGQDARPPHEHDRPPEGDPRPVVIRPAPVDVPGENDAAPLPAEALLRQHEGS